jgi:hypothetical protein
MINKVAALKTISGPVGKPEKFCVEGTRALMRVPTRADDIPMSAESSAIR